MTHTRTMVVYVASLILALIPNATFAHTVSAPLAGRVKAGPAFTFPSNGQSFRLNSTMLFQVQPLSRAMGYLWIFSQNGVIVWQNLDATGSLSGPTMNVKGGSAVQRHMQPGALQVRVRAELKGGSWTSASAIMVQLQGNGLQPHPAPTPKPAPTSAPQIHAGDVLYTANMNTLSGSAAWKHVNGMLVNDGSDGSSVVLPFTSPVADYAVEATVQIISGNNCVLLRTRMQKPAVVTGYYGGVCDGEAKLIAHNGYPVVDDPHAYGSYLNGTPYTSDTNLHTYRLEVRGNDLRLLIDGTPVVEATDNQWLSGRQMGLYSGNTQINVQSIRVIAL